MWDKVGRCNRPLKVALTPPSSGVHLLIPCGILKQVIDDLIKLAAELSEKFSSGEIIFKASCEARTELIVELNHSFFRDAGDGAFGKARSSAQSRAGPFLLPAKLGMKLLVKLEG